ncbi:MAG: sigma 54-interacting transcriptional regulator [Clostridiales Family XIII bacterium]|jgi:transcriptional regulator with PAS, ATPase and Fis domain|nr:sigma 54-interacting transcriptional regulator [Clostridiales Family XIII bacterium]
MDIKQRKILKEHDMERIAAENSNSINLHDRHNNILMTFQGIKVGNLIGFNAGDISAAYNWSPSKRALESKTSVTGTVDTKYGGQQIVCANPLLDDDGEVSFILVTAVDKSLIDRYSSALNDSDTERKFHEITTEFLTGSSFSDDNIVMESQQMRQVIATSRYVAETDSTVMLVGESGTGKEIIARYIHRHSARKNNAFIPVNCAAIPQELMESEFFGYVKGAFTGANPLGKSGLFEMAEGGTLFLDEIGDLPLNMQSKLLRVLESGEVTRLGDTAVKEIDVRLIAATNRDLKEMIVHNLFRRDLYFRINVIPITLPRLANRREDIIPLADVFLEELNKRYGLKKEFTPQAQNAFLMYDWPGNVRELRNVVERMAVTTPGDELYLEDRFLESTRIERLESEDRFHETQISHYAQRDGSLKEVLTRIEEDYIRQVLEASGGNVAKAAQVLGIHRSVLYKKLKALNQKTGADI